MMKLFEVELKQVGSHKLLRKGFMQLTASEYSRIRSSFKSIDSSIGFKIEMPNKRLQDLTEDGNIKPPKYSPIKLDGIEDPKLPNNYDTYAATN